MWATRNRTPYSVGTTWGRTKDGVHEWIVAVRATFDVQPSGATRLADEQPEPLLAPVYWGEDGRSSLRYEADLVAPKPTTDVVLNGTAYAPRGRPAAEFAVSLRVGSVHKSLRVLGDRMWLRGPAGELYPSAPDPVSAVPIVYERAYGGCDESSPDPKKQKMDLRNPVGRGVVSRTELLLDQPLHNFEYVGRSAEKGGPAGLGAIPSHWSPRLELQGTYDDAWQKQRMPLLPLDWDERSLLCSPVDQRPQTHLRGGEPVELVHLTEGGVLRFELPKVYLTFRTSFATIGGKRYEEHRSRLSTVVFEPDHPRVIMVWVSSLLVAQDEDYLDETVVREKPYL